MVTARSDASPLVRHVCRLAAGDRAVLSDSQLLERFVSRRDEAAFAALIRRHGPLVLGVCRRLLHDWHAAEDCAQAVFLVLARKAPSLRRPGPLGPWLHGVATRTALKARTQAMRRRRYERQAARPAAVCDPDPAASRDLRQALDEAVACLPDRYRVPFILHYLEGLSLAEVARRLACPAATVGTRLARARERLRRRLARRGLNLSAGCLPALTHAGAVPVARVTATARAAVLLAAGQALVPNLVPPEVIALTEGVLKMSRTTFYLVAALAVAGAVGLGGPLSQWTESAPKGPATTTLARANSLPDRAPPPERPAPPAVEEVPAPLERYLRRWEKEAREAQPLAAQFTRRDNVKESGDSSRKAGVVRLLAPDRAVLEMHEQEKPESIQKFVLNGRTLYEYVPPRKEVRQGALPSDKRWLAGADLVPLSLFRVRAADVKRAADLKLVKEDPYYVYIALTPRAGAAGVDWTQGRLVLLKSSGLPRQLWLAYPEREITWDIPTTGTDAEMERQQFDPNVPPGWKMIRDP